MGLSFKKTYGSIPDLRPFALTCSVAVLVAASLYGCSGEKNKEPVAAVKEQSGVTAAPPAQTSAVIKAGDPAKGKEIYFKYCHFCHGTKGLGDGPVGLALTPHPADFVNDTKRMSKTDEELFKSITEGIHRDIGGEAMVMPRWREILSEQERWDVLAFIRQLSREGVRRAR